MMIKFWLVTTNICSLFDRMAKRHPADNEIYFFLTHFYNPKGTRSGCRYLGAGWRWLGIRGGSMAGAQAGDGWARVHVGDARRYPSTPWPPSAPFRRMPLSFHSGAAFRSIPGWRSTPFGRSAMAQGLPLCAPRLRSVVRRSSVLARCSRHPGGPPSLTGCPPRRGAAALLRCAPPLSSLPLSGLRARVSPRAMTSLPLSVTRQPSITLQAAPTFQDRGIRLHSATGRHYVAG